jgi:CheY-like chemotaxis protein
MDHVASLRRYAACLVGSNEDGDKLVADVLQRVLEGEMQLDQSAGMRLAMFRALHEIWIIEEVSARATGRRRRHADMMLRLLSPIRRAVLILVRLEAFSEEEASFILGMDVRDIRCRLHEAEEELDRVIARRVLIVEDDLLNGLDLEDLVTSLGHSAIGPAVTPREAVDLAMQEQPDLILSDIRLGDHPSGIEAVQEIRHRLNVPVIFVTGYPKYLNDRAIIENSYVVAKPYSSRAMASCITTALWADNSQR